MRPLLGMWAAGAEATQPPIVFLEYPHLTGLPVVGEEVFIQPGITEGPVDSSTFQLYMDDLPVPGYVGQGPHLVTSAMEGRLLSGVQISIRGTTIGTATSEYIGPVVLNFPTFAPPYFLAPTDRGTFTGADFTNAAKWTKLNVFGQAVEQNGGGETYLASHLGVYTAASVPLSFGGTISTPLVHRGVDGAIAVSAPTLQGNRTRPWEVGGLAGPEVYKLLRGADHVSIKDIIFKDVGTCIRIGAPLSDLLFENLTGDNIRRFIHQDPSSPETSAAVSGYTVRNCNAFGFSKTAIRILGGDNILVEGTDENNPMILDSMFQGPDAFAVGVSFQGLITDAIARFIVAKRCSSEEGPSDFWQGDGILSEATTDNLLIDRCLVQQCSDGGVDLKGGRAIPHELDRVKFYNNGWNIKLWDKANISNSKSRDPRRRGGTGGAYHIHVVCRPVTASNGGSSHYKFTNCSFTEVNTAGGGHVGISEFIGGIPVATESTIEFVNCFHSGPRAFFNNTEVGAGLTIIGTLQQGPVCSTAPTINWEDEGGTPVDPAVGMYMRVTSNFVDWTMGVNALEYQWLRDGIYIDGATEERYQATEDDVGVVLQCRVYGQHPTEIAEGAIDSEQAEAIFGITESDPEPSILEGSPEDTLVEYLNAGGGDTSEWTFAFDTGGNPGGFFKLGAFVPGFGVPLMASATPTDFDILDEHTLAFKATHATFADIFLGTTVLVDKDFAGEVDKYRMISSIPKGDRSGSNWGNAAPITATPTLIAELSAELNLLAAGVNGRILCKGGSYLQTSGIPIPAGLGPDDGHEIWWYGSDRGGNPVGSTGCEISFNTVTNAYVPPHERIASISFKNGDDEEFDPESFTFRVRGNRPIVSHPKWVWFLNGASGTNDFTDGPAVAMQWTKHPNPPTNIAGMVDPDGTTFPYFAYNATEYERGTATKVGATIVRTTITHGTAGAGNKTNFTTPPHVIVERPVSGNISSGNTLFSFGEGVKNLRFSHFRFENMGRAAFTMYADDVRNIIIENFYAKNMQNFLHNGSSAGSNAINQRAHDQIIQHGMCYGFSKGFILYRSGSHHITLNHLYGDSGFQHRDNFANAYAADEATHTDPLLSQASHDITWNWCIGSNCYDGLGSGYWNGDGWAFSGHTLNMVLNNCMAFGNTGSGIDSKSIHTVLNKFIGFFNKENLKMWEESNEYFDVANHDPRSRGGSGGQLAMMHTQASRAWPPQIWTRGHIYLNMVASGLYQGSNKKSALWIRDTIVQCPEGLVTPNIDTQYSELAIGRGSTLNGAPLEDTDVVPTFRTGAQRGLTSPNLYIAWPTSPPTFTDQICFITLLADSGAISQFPEADYYDHWNMKPPIIVENPVGTPAFTVCWGWKRLEGRMFGQQAYVVPGTFGLRAVRFNIYGGCKRTGEPFEDYQVTSGVSSTMTSPSGNATAVGRWLNFFVFSENDATALPAGWTNDHTMATSEGGDGSIIVDGKVSAIGADTASARSAASVNPWACIRVNLLPV